MMKKEKKMAFQPFYLYMRILAKYRNKFNVVYAEGTSKNQEMM